MKTTLLAALFGLSLAAPATAEQCFPSIVTPQDLAMLRGVDKDTTSAAIGTEGVVTLMKSGQLITMSVDIVRIPEISQLLAQTIKHCEERAVATQAAAKQ